MEAVPRRIESILPFGLRKPTVVECRVVTGAALGAWIVDRYPSDHGANPTWQARYRHVPDLALTTVTDAGGKTLFSGLRHGILNVDALDGEALVALADNERRTLIGDLLVGQGRSPCTGRSLEKEIDERCRRVRMSPLYAGSKAARMRCEARGRLVRATLAAALGAEREKFRRALAGETVSLELCCVSLVAPDEIKTWCNQARAFSEVDGRKSVELYVRRWDYQLCRVLVNVKVRQFALPAGEAGLNTSGYENPDVEVGRLLGPVDSIGLGGDVKARVDAMESRIAEYGEKINKLDLDHSSSRAARGADHHESLAQEDRLSKLNQKRDCLIKSATTLEEAGEHLKAMWAARCDWPAGVDAYRKAAPLLALVGHMMGETPLLSCMSGRDHLDRLDGEVKFLATVASKSHGFPDLEELDSAVWGPVRAEFTTR